MSDSFVAPKRSKQAQINAIELAIAEIGMRMAACNQHRIADINGVSDRLVALERQQDGSYQELHTRLTALEQSAARTIPAAEREPGEDNRWCSCKHEALDHEWSDENGRRERCTVSGCNCELFHRVAVPAESDPPSTASDEEDRRFHALERTNVAALGRKLTTEPDDRVMFRRIANSLDLAKHEPGMSLSDRKRVIAEISDSDIGRLSALAAGAPVVAGGADQRVIDLDDLRRLRLIAVSSGSLDLGFLGRIDAVIAGVPSAEPIASVQ